MPSDLATLIYYVGQTPLRGGRVTLAVALFRSDFEAYRLLGAPITGATYVKAAVAGELGVPRGIIDALRMGRRWGAIEHRLYGGRLTWRDACWIAKQWRDGVPV